MKYNYPVKYAAMPIIEQIGWSHGLHELERNYDVVCYIVSKCYLLSDKTKYKENGRSVKEYEVMFPYQRVKNYTWERVIPEFGPTNHAYNSDFVEEVFDNYEDALEIVTQKNKELCDKTWICLSYTNIKEFNDKLSRYKMLEQQILTNTSDLDQSNVRELKRLIINNKGKIEVLFRTLYEYLNSFYYSKFIVYSVSSEQYDKLITLIDSQDVYDVTKVIGNVTPILYNDAKEKNIMVINQNGNVSYYINEWGFLRNCDEQKISSVELNVMNDEISCLFTTETLEDILLSFSDHEYINLNEIQDPILKKTLFDKNMK